MGEGHEPQSHVAMLDWINEILDADHPPSNVSLLSDGIRRTLIQLLHDCDSLYRSSARRILRHAPDQVAGSSERFPELMIDLHRGVVLKTLVEIAHADRRWSLPEREVAALVLRHAWGDTVAEEHLTKALRKLVVQSEKLRWEDLLGPFLKTEVLDCERSELRSIILRLGAVIAKADGQVLPVEQQKLEQIRDDIDQVLNARRNALPEIAPLSPAGQASQKVAAELAHPSGAVKPSNTKPATSTPEEPTPQEREALFAEAQRELSQLIGMDAIKEDISKLMDFLRVQAMRREHNLPTADISLHAVFEGNPGTGKTTVARIIGKLLCGLDILAQGQTIETDRSGLVAPYAGQTGPRTNERVDSALGGVLFVDEAYSLISDNAEDAFGVEAIQALLKRMEDDRDQFVAVLAGYPEPMDRMLRSNPGLKSRFQKKYYFPDYSAKDLLRIYYVFCKEYHYKLPQPTRRKLLQGFQNLIDHKDEHFGNGRLARNVFEESIRNMSTRIVGVSPLTREALVTIEPEDVDFA